jgi:hypothetical protein
MEVMVVMVVMVEGMDLEMDQVCRSQLGRKAAS